MPNEKWWPDASIDVLRRRSDWLKRIRLFFEQHGVLEVETPVLSNASVPDPNIESFQTRFNNRVYYLQTSPELYMKRLLVAGSGPIWQLSRVFRDHELGRLHNPEFTMIEWYRPGFDANQLMQELTELVNRLCFSGQFRSAPVFLTYQELFVEKTGIDPLQIDWDKLNTYCQDAATQALPAIDNDWQAAMDWLLSTQIQPAMTGQVFVYDYPAQQAALARIDSNNPSVAKRFELFVDGIEMANGFEELTDVEEQRSRFEQENKERIAHGLEAVHIDENFLQSLETGLPQCSGVALGLDRLMMWATGAEAVREVMAFGWPE